MDIFLEIRIPFASISVFFCLARSFDLTYFLLSDMLPRGLGVSRKTMTQS